MACFRHLSGSAPSCHRCAPCRGAPFFGRKRLTASDTASPLRSIPWTLTHLQSPHACLKPTSTHVSHACTGLRHHARNCLTHSGESGGSPPHRRLCPRSAVPAPQLASHRIGHRSSALLVVLP